MNNEKCKTHFQHKKQKKEKYTKRDSINIMVANDKVNTMKIVDSGYKYCNQSRQILNFENPKTSRTFQMNDYENMKVNFYWLKTGGRGPYQYELFSS